MRRLIAPILITLGVWFVGKLIEETYGK